MDGISDVFYPGGGTGWNKDQDEVDNKGGEVSWLWEIWNMSRMPINLHVILVNKILVCLSLIRITLKRDTLSTLYY